MNTKTSFPQTQHSACESRSDLFPSSTRPKDPRCIVKAERFASQLPPCFFFFLLWRVIAALEWLEVPSSSSDDSSSSSFGKLNLSNFVASAAIERLSDLRVGPLHFPFLLQPPPWPFPTLPRFSDLKSSVFFCSGVRA
jgi:hypothetical protein